MNERLVQAARRSVRTPLPTVIAIALLAVGLRFADFPGRPAGLNLDEASAGYETYSLLTRHTDRWGNYLPVYFPANGSGQNALQSYLSVPFVWLFGLNTFAVRLLPAILGVVTVVLLYVTVRKVADPVSGLVAAFLLAISPWHIMASRWALESNLLPCFLLIGVSALVYCYEAGPRWRQRLIPVSLAPLGLAMYAYAPSIYVIPLFIAAYLAIRYRVVRRHWRAVLASVGVFLLVAGPLLLFFLDNLVLHYTPAWVENLPFSVPLLPGNRLTEISTSTLIPDNLKFLAAQFDDALIWNRVPGYAPLGLLAIPLAIVGICFCVRRRSTTANIFVIWLAATLPIVFAYPLNINRANAMLLPIIALAGIGVGNLHRALSGTGPALAMTVALLATSAAFTTRFCFDYFGSYNKVIGPVFNIRFDRALDAATAAARPGEPVYVTDTVVLNYVYTLYHFKVDPHDFKYHSEWWIDHERFKVRNYRQYYFWHDDPIFPAADAFVTLRRHDEPSSCDNPTVVYKDKDWTVQRCVAPPIPNDPG